MATILPFSDISNHLNIKPDQRKVLIDTCALIAYSHGASEFSDETENLFITLRQNNFKAYTNVNIRSDGFFDVLGTSTDQFSLYFDNKEVFYFHNLVSFKD